MRCICLFQCAILAGCGGGSGGGSGANGFAGHDALLSDIAAMDVTPAEQLPTSGSVDYAGSAILNMPRQGGAIAYLGDLIVSVDFDTGPAAMVGSLSDFRTSGGDSLGGVLTISGASFDADADPELDYQFRAMLAGTLSQGGTDHALTGSLAGDYRGMQAAAMCGQIFGDVETAGEVAIFDGSFAARAGP